MVAIAALGDQNRRNDTVNDFVGIAPILHDMTEDGLGCGAGCGSERVLLNKYQD